MTNIHRALRMLNPSPYMYYIDFGDTQIVGSSPETMIKLDRGVAMTRPIAGAQSLLPAEFQELMKHLRQIAGTIGRDIH